MKSKVKETRVLYHLLLPCVGDLLQIKGINTQFLLIYQTAAQIWH